MIILFIICWVLHKGEDSIPLPYSKLISHQTSCDQAKKRLKVTVTHCLLQVIETSLGIVLNKKASDPKTK